LNALSKLNIDLSKIKFILQDNSFAQNNYFPENFVGKEILFYFVIQSTFKYG